MQPALKPAFTSAYRWKFYGKIPFRTSSAGRFENTKIIPNISTRVLISMSSPAETASHLLRIAAGYDKM
jgi:hypothetical protein